LLLSIVAWIVGILLSDGFESDVYRGVTESFLFWPIAPVVQVLVASIAVWLSVPRRHTPTRVRAAAWCLGGVTCALAILRPSIVVIAMGCVVRDLDTLACSADAAWSATIGEPIECLGSGATLDGRADRRGAYGWTFAI
jgi:hypothetical protein